MQTKSISGLLLLAVLITGGCADPDLSPILTEDKYLYGAFPRLISLGTTVFDIENKDDSSVTLEVDFVDNTGGENVAEYNVYVGFNDNNPENGDMSADPELFLVQTPTNFTEGPNGNLSTQFTLSFEEAAQVTGIDIDSVQSGDVFNVVTEVVTDDGRLFTDANSTAAITNAFNGIFEFQIDATCPLPDDQFSGMYKVEYGEVYDTISFLGETVQAIGPLNDRMVELEVVSSTRRSFNVGSTYLAPGFSFAPGDIELFFACDEITAEDIDSGESCGAGTIRARQDSTDAFDISDDSSFTLRYTDFFDDGDCGQTPLPFTLVFTKQ
jgi:hypothetical protein